MSGDAGRGQTPIDRGCNPEAGRSGADVLPHPTPATSGRRQRVMRVPRWAWSWGRSTLYGRDGTERCRYLSLGPVAVRLSTDARTPVPCPRGQAHHAELCGDYECASDDASGGAS